MQLKQYPFYLKSTAILLGIVLFVYVLINLSGVLIPFSFALIIAILLNPLVTKLQNKGVHKIVAIVLSLALAFLIVGSIMYFITTKIISFGDNHPQLRMKFKKHQFQ